MLKYRKIDIDEVLERYVKKRSRFGKPMMCLWLLREPEIVVQARGVYSASSTSS